MSGSAGFLERQGITPLGFMCSTDLTSELRGDLPKSMAATESGVWRSGELAHSECKSGPQMMGQLAATLMLAHAEVPGATCIYRCASFPIVEHPLLDPYIFADAVHTDS